MQPTQLAEAMSHAIGPRNGAMLGVGGWTRSTTPIARDQRTWKVAGRSASYYVIIG